MFSASRQLSSAVLRVSAIHLVSAAVLLAGCSSPADSTKSDGAGEAIPIGKVPVITSGDQLTFPLDAYQLTPAQSRQMDEALDTLVADCMTKQGFPWEPPNRPPLRDGSRNNRRYGLLDSEEGSRTGYHGVGATGRGAKGNETGRDTSPAAQKAAGDCVISQRAKLNGQQKADRSATGPDEFVEQLVAEDAARAEKDPQVQAVFAKWSSCMAKSGYSYDGPWDANNDPEWRKTDTAGSRERAVAAADVACKRQANLAGIWMAVETAYQQRTLEKKAESLAGAKKTNELRLRNAAEVLGRG